MSKLPEPHERIDFCFEATKWQGELTNAEPDKCDELRWTPLNDLPENIAPEVRHMLEQFTAHQPYSSFGFDA
jgi:8-oxo-dGTP diphosphatase